MIAFQQYLAKIRKNAAASINRKIFTLRSFQNYLELKGDEKAQHLPFKKALKIRVTRPYKANFLSKEEIKKLFASINTGSVIGMLDYAVCALMFLLGLRVGEVHRLNLGHVDWNENKITIIGKCAVKRTLMLTKELKTILENYLAVRKYIYKAENTEAFYVSNVGNPSALVTFPSAEKGVFLFQDFSNPTMNLRIQCCCFKE